jgi:hypothetical protein
MNMVYLFIQVSKRDMIKLVEWGAKPVEDKGKRPFPFCLREPLIW